ncbi:DMT family protein [Novosphingobium sp. 1949]|uniref:DMT family protein n=1 Tax=Novosphingobium organovorum TaxID=2930092 RepID=A0ABT0BBU7_9SPHN|nr:DMT family protein [Novosphingobium organovorum]MCJ2182281.1 DMT family protein [Novosphingobium organovorum]
MNWAFVAPVVMLAGSNLLMNTAWYWHLKVPGKALWLAVLLSWGIAFFEYWLAVPANRIGARVYSLDQLKVLQEAMSLGAFVVVAWFLFGQKPGLNELVGFALVGAGAWFIFKGPLR